MLLMQHFTFAFADPQPEHLRIYQTTYMRPKEVLIHATPRTDRRMPVLSGRPTTQTNGAAAEAELGNDVEGGHPLYVYYGSDMGTSETFAKRVAADARQRGMILSVRRMLCLR